jgi:uncharacterized DUF497 family protein
MIEFQWDPKKARDNLAKHGVSFEEVKSVFFDEYARQFFDEAHSDDEERFIMLVSATSPAFWLSVTANGTRATPFGSFLLAKRQLRSASTTQAQYHEKGI